MNISHLFKGDNRSQLVKNWTKMTLGLIDKNNRLDKEVLGIADGESIIIEYLKNREVGLAFEHLTYMINETGLYLNQLQEKALIEFAEKNSLDRPEFLIPTEFDVRDFYTILKKFNECQSVVVNKLIELWSASLPITTIEWPVWSQSQYDEDQFTNEYGIRIFPHGFGLSYQDSEFYIDFDFGENGETNGFDSNRIWLFAERNGINTQLINENQIQKIIEDQVLKGNLKFSGYINYYPEKEL